VVDEGALRKKFQLLSPTLNERARRLVFGAEAQTIGRGGVSAVARAAGVSRNTVARGIQDLRSPTRMDPSRVRRWGAGRKPLASLDRSLTRDLERLVEPTTRGDPESPLRWTCKSTRKLAEELKREGHQISHTVVAALLHEMGYSLQSNRKTKEGAKHPDRNAQFEHINRTVRAQLRAHDPAISVDTKKKELVGDFRNTGREWRPRGKPEKVRVHDFLIEELGKAIPYGVYDMDKNLGWVGVGVDHDTAQFAVATIRKWYRQQGRKLYRRARSVLIVADAGGSNGPRVRLWKWELQKLSNETGLAIKVCHLPPGTSKWNKIEHRLFSFITQNWRGRPLLTHAVIVNLIASTTTRSGLKVHCYLDRGRYPPKQEVSDEQMAQLNIHPDKFHGEWNYTVRPTRRHQPKN
jgi:transposase